MITPNPTDSEKKICPLAASQVSDRPKAWKSGFHMKPSPASTLSAGRVNTRTSTHKAQTTIRGIANLQNVSMPLETPR